VSVIINEVDSDTPSTDAAEFVELYDGGGGNTSLTGLVVVFFNGSNDLSYAAFDLDGFTTDASGYFVLGNTAVSGVDLVFTNNILQNGADAVALYTANASDFPTNTAVTTTNLVDALVYDTSDADDAGLLVLLNSSQPQVNEDANGSPDSQSNQRCPNGSGGARNTSTYIQASPTPGAANMCPAPMCTLTPATATNLVGSNHSVKATLTLSGGPLAGVNVTFSVTSGPNTGAGNSALTDMNGEATFGYMSNGMTGSDTIQASATVNGTPVSCMAQKQWVSTTVIINEIDSDTPGSDAAEFVELYDGGVGNTSLNGLVVVFYNGSNDQSYAAFDLDGFMTDASGYFVLGSAAVANVDLVFSNNLMQNGADAVALYLANTTDFPNGTAVTTANLVDAVVYDTNDADDAGLLALVNTGQPQVNEDGGGDSESDSIQRCPNGTGGARNTNAYRQSSPTPDATNLCNRPPEAKCKDVSVQAGPNCQAAASINNNSSDPDLDMITLQQSPPGPYPLGMTAVTLTVTDSQGASAECMGTVTVTNNPPAVNAGPDQTIAEGSLVMLTGSGNDVNSGQSLSFQWTQTSGPSVTLNGATTSTATFTAPNGPAMLSFQLKATDSCLVSVTDEVKVTVVDLLVVQDDRNGNCLSVNLQAGTYTFKTVGHGIFMGQATASRQGDFLIIRSRSGSANRLEGAVDLRRRTGKATLRVGTRTFGISDANIDNNGACSP
jgi:hypothetical protein